MPVWGKSIVSVVARASAAGRPFGRRADGTVAVIFGLALVPMLLFAGSAIDYGRASNAKAALAAALDAAALLTVNNRAMVTSSALAERQAIDYFKQKAATVANATGIELVLKVKDENGRRVTQASFKAVVPTTLMRLAAIPNIAIGENASAVSELPSYIDFYLLLDNTPSMGVGATPSDVSTMVNNTSDRCAFACHDVSAKGKDYYALAKKLSVTMRIDVVRQATQRLMDTAAASATVPDQFRAALYTFGKSCENLGLETISSLDAKLSKVKKDAEKIDLMTIPYQNYNNDQCTDYDGTFAALNKAIPNPGDGNSAASPQKVVFFVSDGVADAYYPSTCSRVTTGGRCQEPIKVADCKALKDRGIRVAVLYTTYLPLPTNAWYNTWIAPFASTISTRMSDCASPGLYFEVSPTEGIAEAMEALFEKAISQARLTN